MHQPSRNWRRFAVLFSIFEEDGKRDVVRKVAFFIMVQRRLLVVPRDFLRLLQRGELRRAASEHFRAQPLRLQLLALAAQVGGDLGLLDSLLGVDGVVAAGSPRSSAPAQRP